MRIESVLCSTCSTVPAVKKSTQTNPAKELQQQEPAPLSVPPSQQVELSDTSSEAASSSKAHGVLRLLLEGHFKGVADVRLRINFFDELQKIAGEKLGPALEQGLPSLMDTVDQEFEKLLAADTLAEDQRVSLETLKANFLDSLRQMGEEFITSGALSGDDFLTKLRASFEDFASAILKTESNSTAGKVTEVVDEAASPDTEVAAESTEGIPADEIATQSVPSVNLETFVSQLRQAFTESLATLEQSLQSAFELPELTPAKGQGRAYEKFLAVYQGLTNPEASSEQTASMENSVETLA
jgi:hypothetical protein